MEISTIIDWWTPWSLLKVSGKQYLPFVTFSSNWITKSSIHRVSWCLLLTCVCCLCLVCHQGVCIPAPCPLDSPADRCTILCRSFKSSVWQKIKWKSEEWLTQKIINNLKICSRARKIHRDAGETMIIALSKIPRGILLFHSLILISLKPLKYDWFYFKKIQKRNFTFTVLWFCTFKLTSVNLENPGVSRKSLYLSHFVTDFSSCYFFPHKEGRLMSTNWTPWWKTWGWKFQKWNIRTWPRAYQWTVSVRSNSPESTGTQEFVFGLGWFLLWWWW